MPGLLQSFGLLTRPLPFLQRCRRRYGDVFTIRAAPYGTMVYLADPALVKTVFTGSPETFHTGEVRAVLAPVLGHHSLLLLDEDEHLAHRRLLLPPFHGERMRDYGAMMEEVAERRIAAWPADREFPSLPSMQAITLEVIMRAVFGFDDAERRERIGGPLRRLLDMVASRPRVLAMALTAGRNGTLSPWRRFAAQRERADVLLHEEIAARRRDPDGAAGDDIFSLLLAARDPDGRPLSDSELRDELMTLLLAGHETTATALAWTFERLTREPAVLDRLIAAEAAGDDDYLDAVIKETLRLRPVVPAVVRRLQGPMEIGGWELDAGVNIAPSIYLLHRHPDLYPAPLEYRPERFLDDPPGTYEWIPFGGGVRRCLGASFAVFEMKIVIRAVLAARRLRPRPGARPEGVTRRAITFAPTRGGRIRAELPAVG